MDKSKMNLKNPIIKYMQYSLINLPTPVNISTWWNFGSMLGLCLMIQIISGLFLSMHYCPNTDMAFKSVIHIIQDVKYGWIMRNIHLNGASMFFACMYLHIGRGIYYHSFKSMYVWTIGVSILLMSMATAFLGYVLPWGQMSFWGATVITNLISAFPYIGNYIVEWLWGGFSIDNPTLNRFYSIHFILPFIIFMMVILHLAALHTDGSSNPLGVNSNFYKIYFHSIFTIKDSLGFMLIFMIFSYLILMDPYMLGDPDNFMTANPMITPVHIQPEWYFLFAYAILRSIPNKLGGVIALILSIMILYAMPFNMNYNFSTTRFYPINQIMFWLFISSFILLTWTGSQPIIFPFYMISQINAIIYFSFFIITPMFNQFWDKFYIIN